FFFNTTPSPYIYTLSLHDALPILDFFKEKYPQVEFETWTTRMAKGEVIDETGRRVDQQTAYRAGACIYYYRELEDEKIIPYVERSEEHTSELQSPCNLVCRLLLEK